MTKTGPRPVVLGTLSVRPDPTAEDMAVGSALEAGVPLLVVNVVRLPPYSGRSGTRMRNSEDGIYAEAGSGALVRLRRRKASTIRKGLIGTITVGIDPS